MLFEFTQTVAPFSVRLPEFTQNALAAVGSNTNMGKKPGALVSQLATLRTVQGRGDEAVHPPSEKPRYPDRGGSDGRSGGGGGGVGIVIRSRDFH